jgi:hypothetical protein
MKKKHPGHAAGGPTKENVMILALPFAIIGAAFLTYVRLATR